MHYIEKLIREGEHQRLDFKFEISDSRKIAKSLVAFANTDGGTLLVGVKDNGKIAGVRSDEEIYMVEAAASMYCAPRVEIHFKRWSIGGKQVLEVLVPKSENGPHAVKMTNNEVLFYLRVNDENILANSVQIKVWKQKSISRGVFLEFTEKENILLKYLEENEFMSLTKYCKMALITRKNAENIIAKLIALGAVNMKYSEGHFVYCRQF